jgi:WD40 repeat protein
MQFDVPRRQLRALLEEHGLDLLDEPDRCEALLEQACPGYTPVVRMLTAVLQMRIPTDLKAGMGGVALAKQILVFSRQLEEAGYEPAAARWAVEAWAYALRLIRDEDVSPAPSDQDAPPVKQQAPAAAWYWIGTVLYHAAIPAVWALTAVNGWALGSVAGWLLAGEGGVRPFGWLGLTGMIALFAGARAQNRRTKHPLLRSYLAFAGPATVLVGAARAIEVSPALYVLALPFVALFSWIVLCYPPSFVRTGRAACVGGAAGALAGGFGLLADSLAGWVCGGVVGLALYLGVDTWLTAEAARGEESRDWVARQAAWGAFRGAAYGAVAAFLCYVIITTCTAAWQRPAAGAAPQAVLKAVIDTALPYLYLQGILWAVGWWAAVSHGRRKRKAKGGKLFEGHSGPVRAVAFSPDGSRILSGSTDCSARLWDVETRRSLRRFSAAGVSGGATAVFFPAEPNQVLTAGAEPKLRWWDAESGKELDTLSLPYRGTQGLAVALSPDERFALVGSFGQGRSHWSVYLWDLDDRVLIRTFKGHGNFFRGGAITCVAFSPDGRFAVSGSNDGTARVWDVATGDELHCFSGHRKKVNAVAFSPDGCRVLSAGDDKLLRLWDAQTGEQLRALEGHTGEVQCVCFSPDGRYAVSGGKDQTARLWDVEAGRETSRFAGDDGKGFGTVNCVAFAPDGNSVVLGCADHSVRLWRLRPERAHNLAIPAEVVTAIREGPRHPDSRIR